MRRIYAVCKSLLISPIITAYGSESLRIVLFDFTCYIEHLLNFSIPLSHISM